MVVIQALAVLAKRGAAVVVAASGNPNDVRHAGHHRELMHRVADLGVGDGFRLLGMLPYEDVTGLIALCHALVNPSFFEGWSTTVEEAKALGAPLVLSEIDVHREQAGSKALYFDPKSPESAADAMFEAWHRNGLLAASQRRQVAAKESVVRVREFAASFANAAHIAYERGTRTRSSGEFGHG
jgi:glycosyltransferase involved in cell wall biosynthesis